MPRKEDDRLRLRIDNKLGNIGLRAPCRISVDVYEDQVTLTGIVLYDYQKRAAIQAARSMEGVRTIIDRLKVQPPLKKWDDEPELGHGTLPPEPEPQA